jgi:ArsR family transcriptional regulator, arsenate/arsenite/antimonite-responsive transcriptional repressor
MKISRSEAELFSTWFRCLADPTRILILHLLASERRPMRVSEIVERLDVGQSTVSEHLRRLAEARFVLVEHRGTTSHFELNQRCLEALPSASELIVGKARAESLPVPVPGAASRRDTVPARQRSSRPASRST